MDEAAAVTTPVGAYWKPWLAVLVVAIFGYGFFFSTNNIPRIGYLLGQALILTVFLLGTFKLSPIKVPTRSTYGLIFAVLLVACMTSQYMAATRTLAQEDIALAEISDAANDLRTSGWQPVNQNTNKLTRQRATGEAGEMERFVKGYMTKIVTLQTEQANELENIGWPTILSPPRLRNDPSLSQSFRILANTKNVVTIYKAKHSSVTEGRLLEIATLNLSEKSRDEVLTAFNKGIAANRSATESAWDIQARIVNQTETILKFLKRNQGKWTATDYNIHFANETLLREYQLHFERIRALAIEETQLRETQFLKFNKNVDELKSR